MEYQLNALCKRNMRWVIKNSDSELSGSVGRPKIASLPALVSFAIGATFLVFMLTRFSVDMEATWQTIASSNPLIYFAALLLHYATFPFRGARWRVLLRNAGVGEVTDLPSISAAARFVLIGWFVSSITWFRLGDGYRAYAYCEEGRSPLSRVVGTVVAERVMDVIIVFLLLLAGFVFLYIDPHLRPPGTFVVIALGLAIASGSFLLVMAIFRSGILRIIPKRIARIYSEFHEGTIGSFRDLRSVFLLGFLAWLCEVGRLYMVIWAAGLDVGLGLIFFVTLANALLTAVPLTPGGLGIVESGIVGLLTWVLSGSDAVSVALLDRSISYLSIILVGSIFFVYHRRIVAGHSRDVRSRNYRDDGWTDDGL
jgi:uncharacterized protein (TIRG00374 family)